MMKVGRLIFYRSTFLLPERGSGNRAGLVEGDDNRMQECYGDIIGHGLESFESLEDEE